MGVLDGHHLGQAHRRDVSRSAAPLLHQPGEQQEDVQRALDLAGVARQSLREHLLAALVGQGRGQSWT